jgi:hypothetical protein
MGIVAAAPALAIGQSAVALAAPAAPAVLTARSAQAPLTRALAAQLAKNVNQHVIVIMKTQFPAAQVGTRAQAARSAAAVSSQAALRSELTQVHASHVRSYSLVNAMAATVSAGEVARLKANPAVGKVIPDVIIHGARPGQAPVTSAKAGPSTALTPHVIPNACGKNGKVLLDPEGLATTHTASDNPHAKTARSLGITGAGVKVAWIADGIDPNNVNFLRDPSNPGSTAFADYQDFTGDGPGVATSGDEAFLDANTIAGQGKVTYDVSHFSAQPDPAACNIRIEGVAPGASLVGLDVFGSNEDTTESNFLQAINYAVATDHVDVINESFGSNPFPDVASLDVTAQFNDAAVKAGVVVSVSSGDAGTTNTIGSPSTDTNVLSVGASTDFRFYAQTNYASARYFATKGWLNNNISSLSSAGFTESGSTVNLIAPGDLSFASCDASAQFAGCANFLGQPSDVEEAGGTSESAPFVSGAAALVIEAYQKTHAGHSPSPSLVRQFLDSTATDLGAPATEQGAGLLNTYKAVQLAESFQSPHPVGNTLMINQARLHVTGFPGTSAGRGLLVNNEGSRPQTVHLRTRTLGPEEHVQSGSVTLTDGHSPQFVNFQGLPNNYGVFHFRVTPGQRRLDASIAYPADLANGNNARVRLILVDSRGRFAAHSLPQGVGNFGNVDVRNPAPGRWTGVIFGITKAGNGTNGKVPWRVATQHFAAFSGVSVSPSTFTLPPGEGKIVSVTAKLPGSAGDTAGSIVVRSNRDPGQHTSVAVTLRSRIDLSRDGSFHGILTGGNGRPNGEGQTDYYQFRVKPGMHNLTANVTLTNDQGDPVGAYLVDPQGDVQGYGENFLASSFTQTGAINLSPKKSLTAYTLNPSAGDWTLIVDFAEPIVGDEVSQHYSGSIRVNAVQAFAGGLPNSKNVKLKAGHAHSITVKITNKGAAPQDFFVDARLNGLTNVALAPLDNATGLHLPLTVNPPLYLVPSQTTGVFITAVGSLPMMFDYGPTVGDPDLASGPGSGSLCKMNPTASFTPSGGRLSAGIWFVTPSECGPYSAPAPFGVVSSVSMVARTKMFDPAVTSGPGDFWKAAVNPAAQFGLFVIQPGQTRTIQATIRPAKGTAGQVIHGRLYVDTFLADVPPYGQETGDQLASFPYTYTVK